MWVLEANLGALYKSNKCSVVVCTETSPHKLMFEQPLSSWWLLGRVRCGFADAVCH